jgi:hypothetical protein
MKRKIGMLVGMSAVSVLLATVAEAVMVMPLSIEEMTQRAEKIFVGKCTHAERSVSPQGIPVLTLTFAVGEVLKGNVGLTVTFRQLDPSPQSPRNPRVRSIWSGAALANVPTYTPGEESLLFLAREGQLGLTAPVGLLQGKLPVATAPTGEKQITNSALKQTQRPNISVPEPGKAAHYGQFVAAIRTLVQPAQ